MAPGTSLMYLSGAKQTARPWPREVTLVQVWRLLPQGRAQAPVGWLPTFRCQDPSRGPGTCHTPKSWVLSTPCLARLVKCAQTAHSCCSWLYCASQTQLFFFFSQIEALWQFCVKPVCTRHFSNSSDDH